MKTQAVPQRTSGACNDPQQPTVYLTVADVAQQLRITRAMVYGWVFRRDSPHLKVGRFIRIDPADLAHFLNLRRRGHFGGQS